VLPPRNELLDVLLERAHSEGYLLKKVAARIEELETTLAMICDAIDGDNPKTDIALIQDPLGWIEALARPVLEKRWKSYFSN
jgi:hypothetical protein